jgi:DNA polymerase IV
VGKATARELQTLGVATIGQLQRLAPTVLTARLGPHGPDLLALAFGRDARPVEAYTAPKSMGAETTFGRDCSDPARLHDTLRGQAERVARELRAEGLAACRVTLKLRWADFRTLTRSHTGDPTQDGLEIYRRAAVLLARERLIQPVRLIGVSASTFRSEAHGQLPLLDPNAVRRERLARAVDRITARFGRAAIVPARLLGRVDDAE